MPSPPPVPLVLKIQLFGTWTGKPWANIFHAKWSGGVPSAADCGSLATQFATQYHVDFMPFMPATVTLDHTMVTDLSTLASASTDKSTAFNGSHSAAFTVPNSVAFGIDWHAPTRYRGGHSKTFLPGFTSGSLTDPITWDSTVVTNVQLAANDWLSTIVGFTSGTTVIGGMVVVHYRKNNVQLANPTVEDITSATARPLIYSQRGRRS